MVSAVRQVSPSSCAIGPIPGMSLAVDSGRVGFSGVDRSNFARYGHDKGTKLGTQRIE